MLTALALNLVYFSAAATAFGLLLRSGRRAERIAAADRRVTRTATLNDFFRNPLQIV